MKTKKIIIALIVLAALIAIARLYCSKHTQNRGHNMEWQQTGDMVDQNSNMQAQYTNTIDSQDTLGNSTGNTSAISPEFKAKLEAQQKMARSGNQITKEDIKLIEDILRQITNGTGESGTGGK